MIGQDEPHRDLAALVVALRGSLVATDGPWEPYRLVDPAGQVVAPVRSYLAHLQAAGRATATQRSYGMDLLRWFRFLWAVEVAWDKATRIEGRDFCRWMLVADKPVRSHWRSASTDTTGVTAADGRTYAPATRAHNESVLRHFYDFHLEAGGGPMVNPFPLARGRDGGRRHAHHNPLEPFGPQPSGLYRPRLTSRVPRHIPDEQFNQLFAALMLL